MFDFHVSPQECIEIYLVTHSNVDLSSLQQIQRAFARDIMCKERRQMRRGFRVDRVVKGSIIIAFPAMSYGGGGNTKGQIL